MVFAVLMYGGVELFPSVNNCLSFNILVSSHLRSHMTAAGFGPRLVSQNVRGWLFLNLVLRCTVYIHYSGFLPPRSVYSE